MPTRAHRGLRSGSWFDAEKVLLDPYGLPSPPRDIRRRQRRGPADNVAVAMKSVVADPWSPGRSQDDLPLSAGFCRSTVIYELQRAVVHICHPSSDVAIEKRGTYAGTRSSPVPQRSGRHSSGAAARFDAQDCPPGKTNYWGCSAVSFFAPHQAYSSQKSSLAVLFDEFRDMVKALHRAGLEVILMLYSITQQKRRIGPTLSYRGLANDVYYFDRDKSHYADYTGCGNTLMWTQPDRAPPDPGHPDACRRIPFRSRVDPVGDEEGRR